MNSRLAQLISRLPSHLPLLAFLEVGPNDGQSPTVCDVLLCLIVLKRYSFLTIVGAVSIV